MFRLDHGRSHAYCDGSSRRSFLQLGVAGMASVALPSVLKSKDDSAASGTVAKSTSIILVWLDGGPSHLDMYDMKPDAPEEIRGIWRPIRSSVPGFEMTELYPKQAKVAHHFSIVRSLHHDTGDHFAGAHRMLTAKDLGVSGANTSPKFPGLGAIVHRELGSRKSGVPGYVAAPHAASVGLAPGYFGGHMLGTQHDPFLAGDPNPDGYRVRNLNLAEGLSIEKLDDRRALLKHFDRAEKYLERHPTVQAMDRFGREALELVVGPAARTAFDIGRENARLRDRYGRNDFGQSLLLSRRLVEAGSTFVTVHSGGWDHHWDLKASYERMLPIVDAGMAALFEDLAERGLLETTLVVLCGEFGRTPKMNDGGNGGAPMSQGTPGRDHWGNAMFCLMGGGGVRGGVVVGETDGRGTAPKSRAVTPSNIHATIYRVLGLDPKLQLLDPGGRPVNTLDDPEPIRELF